MALFRSVVAVLLCALPILQACALAPAQSQPLVVVDYSFFTGNLDSGSTPVTRVNGYLSSTGSAKCYVRVQYLADMPASMITGRFYEPKGALVQEVKLKEEARKAGDTSVWIFATSRLRAVSYNTGIWRLEVDHGPLLVLIEHFSVGNYLVRLSIRGFSPEFNVKIAVDGKEAGSIRGGENKQSALITGAHTVSVGSVINATSYTRYVIQTNSWNVSSSSSHTFAYLTQYYLNVTSPYGKTTGSGWYRNGTKATFTAQSLVASGPGNGYAFANWTGNIDQYTNASDRRGMILMSGPKNVTANYRTQYYLRVRSQFGSPEGEGWYDPGSTATVSVAASDRFPNGTQVLLSDGTQIFLPNGTQVFFLGWTGDTASSNNTTTILMDKPHAVVANWKVETAPAQILQGQPPYFAIAVIIIIVLALFFVLVSRRKRTLVARTIGLMKPDPSSV